MTSEFSTTNFEIALEGWGETTSRSGPGLCGVADPCGAVRKRVALIAQGSRCHRRPPAFALGLSLRRSDIPGDNGRERRLILPWPRCSWRAGRSLPRAGRTLVLSNRTSPRGVGSNSGMPPPSPCPHDDVNADKNIPLHDLSLSRTGWGHLVGVIAWLTFSRREHPWAARSIHPPPLTRACRHVG